MFPFFKEYENRLSYVLRNTYLADPMMAVRFAMRSILKRDHRHSVKSLGRILIDSVRGAQIAFRGAFLTRQGELIKIFPNFATIRYLEAFDISINEILKSHGIHMQDGLFLCIADRGIKLDAGLSTGTLSAVYSNDVSFSCYRNSIFARPINEFSHHLPQGFRSIAPHMYVSGDVESSAFFCNFSSDLDYRVTANPMVRLYRNKTDFLEGKFGEIPPFGGHEKSMRELFGNEVENFLKPSGGSGTLLAEEKGVTLSSIHLIRNRKKRTISIEHTRPTHMYVM